jgi:hypothetical protein
VLDSLAHNCVIRADPFGVFGRGVLVTLQLRLMVRKRC